MTNITIWLLSKGLSNDRLCIGGELLDNMLCKKFFSEKGAANIMRQLLSAVAYCHSKKVVHRDLKLENLLFSSHDKDAALKIIDFGAAQVLNSDIKLSARIGTPLYIAPEVLSGEYTKSCDIWSCGVILYILLSGLPPFSASCEAELYKKIKRAQYKLTGPRWKVLSKEAKDLVHRMMKRDPERRYSALEALNHPWIINNCSDDANRSEAKSLLTEVASFNPEYNLQQVVLLYIVSQLLSDKEKMKVHSLFLSLDKDKDGKLCIEELMQGYKECFGRACPTEKELERIIQKVNASGNDYLELTEFAVAAINKRKILSTKRLIAAFKMFDRDSNGVISADDLKELLCKEANIPDEHWKELIREVDLYGDEQISFKGFTTMMYKLIENV